MITTSLDKSIIALLQGDIPLTPTPYADLASELGIDEELLLAKVKEFKEKGILRRIGAILYHQQAGYAYNSMCAWQVSPERVEEVGKIMASFSQASHVYQRPTYEDWPYNLFTMIHGRTREECEAVSREISRKTGIKHYILLNSTREFKKVSMEYYQADEPGKSVNKET